MDFIAQQIAKSSPLDYAFHNEFNSRLNGEGSDPPEWRRVMRLGRDLFHQIGILFCAKPPPCFQHIKLLGREENLHLNNPDDVKAFQAYMRLYAKKCVSYRYLDSHTCPSMESFLERSIEYHTTHYVTKLEKKFTDLNGHFVITRITDFQQAYTQTITHDIPHKIEVDIVSEQAKLNPRPYYEIQLRRTLREDGFGMRQGGSITMEWNEYLTHTNPSIRYLGTKAYMSFIAGDVENFMQFSEAVQIILREELIAECEEERKQKVKQQQKSKKTPSYIEKLPQEKEPLQRPCLETLNQILHRVSCAINKKECAQFTLVASPHKQIRTRKKEPVAHEVLWKESNNAFYFLCDHVKRWGECKTLSDLNGFTDKTSQGNFRYRGIKQQKQEEMWQRHHIADLDIVMASSWFRENYTKASHEQSNTLLLSVVRVDAEEQILLEPSVAVVCINPDGGIYHAFIHSAKDLQHSGQDVKELLSLTFDGLEGSNEAKPSSRVALSETPFEFISRTGGELPYIRLTKSPLPHLGYLVILPTTMAQNI